MQKNSEIGYLHSNPPLCDLFEVFTEGKTGPEMSKGFTWPHITTLFSQSPLPTPCHMDMAPGGSGPWPQRRWSPHSAPSLPSRGQDYSALIQVE